MNERATHFLVLWPAAEDGDALARMGRVIARAYAGDEAFALPDPHLTLHRFTPAPGASLGLDRFFAAPGGGRGPLAVRHHGPIDFVHEETGIANSSWRIDMSPPLVRLHRETGALLRRAGIETVDAERWQAHVTISRGVAIRDRRPEALSRPAIAALEHVAVMDRIELTRREPDGGFTVLATRRLAPPADLPGAPPRTLPPRAPRARVEADADAPRQAEAPRKHEFIVTTLEGSYLEIGRSAGAAMRGVRYPYLANLWENFSFPEPSAANLREIVAILGDLCPPILEEMIGFAEGAALPTHRLLVGLSGWGFTPKIFQGCSQVAILPERSGGATLCARAYDFSDDERHSESRLTLIYPRGGTSTLGTGEFIFGRLEGINGHGLYVGIGYAHGRGANPRGVFFPMLVRAALEMRRTAREAAEFLRDAPHSSTYNFLVADPREAFVVEASPEKTRIRPPEDGALFATNHYRHPDMAVHQRRVMANSREREETIRRFLARNPRVGPDDLKRLLSGHRPEGLCMHRYRFLLGTLWAAVFDLGSLTADYTPGPPCANPWFRIPFAERPAIRRRIPMILEEKGK